MEGFGVFTVDIRLNKKDITQWHLQSFQGPCGYIHHWLPSDKFPIFDISFIDTHTPEQKKNRTGCNFSQTNAIITTAFFRSLSQFCIRVFSPSAPLMAIFLWMRVRVTNKMPNESENLFASVYELLNSHRMCQAKSRKKLNKIYIYDFRCWWAMVYLICAGRAFGSAHITHCVRQCDTRHRSRNLFFSPSPAGSMLCSPYTCMYFVLHILLLVEGKAAHKTYWNRNESTDWYVRQCVSWFRVSFFVFSFPFAIFVPLDTVVVHKYRLQNEIGVYDAWKVMYATSWSLRKIPKFGLLIKKRRQSQRQSETNEYMKTGKKKILSSWPSLWVFVVVV